MESPAKTSAAPLSRRQLFRIGLENGLAMAAVAAVGNAASVAPSATRRHCTQNARGFPASSQLEHSAIVGTACAAVAAADGFVTDRLPSMNERMLDTPIGQQQATRRDIVYASAMASSVLAAVPLIAVIPQPSFCGPATPQSISALLSTLDDAALYELFAYWKGQYANATQSRDTANAQACHQRLSDIADEIARRAERDMPAL